MTRNPATLRTYAATTALVMALGLIFATSARADTCRTTNLLSWESSGEQDQIRTGIVGDYYWVQLGEWTGQDEYEGTISYQIPAGAVSATACSDGTVTFDIPEPAEVPVVIDVEPQPVLVEVWMPYNLNFSLLPA